MKKSTKIYYALLCFFAFIPFQNCGQLSSTQSSSENSSSSTDTVGDETSGTGPYVVYEGCEAPSSSFARTLYADPVSGADTNAGTIDAPFKTVSAAIYAHKIQPGDKVIAKAGNHGDLSITSYTNAELVNSTNWIHIQGEAGALLSRLSISGLKRILVSNFEVSSPSGTLASVSKANHIVIADSFIYTTKDTSTWTASHWISNVANGLSVGGGSCTSILRNTIKNVRFGMTTGTSDLLPPANQINALFLENTIQYYSGDGFRPLASNILFRNNRILDILVGESDGDTNHDDAIQGFNLGTWGATAYDNIVIDGTWVQESTNTATPFRTVHQGISVFDGLYTNMVVRNNVVITSHWHGISLYGPDHAIIENNTVIPLITAMTPWIMITDAKGGQKPVASIMRNNISPTFNVGANTTSTNNIQIGLAQAPTTYVQFDSTNMLFNPHLLSTSSAYGKGAGVDP